MLLPAALPLGELDEPDELDELPAPGAVDFAPLEQAVTATASPRATADAVNAETFMITSITLSTSHERLMWALQIIRA